MEYTRGIAVRCVDEGVEDVSRLMNEIDIQLRKKLVARFVLCCDVEDDCDVCRESDMSLPYPFEDGTYVIALRTTRSRVTDIVLEVLEKYPQVELA